MKYLTLVFLLTSFSIFAFEPEFGNNSVSMNCFESGNNQHLSYSRKKNFPQPKINYNNYNCLDVSKKIKKKENVKDPSKKVGMGAAIILNPVGAAYWLINKAINAGVDKTINK